jgi:cation diffusion facilitator family transporter
LLAIVGLNFILDGIEALRNHQQANFGTIAVVVTIISIIVKEALAQYALRTGKKYGSSSVQADGHHHRSDALSSAVLLIGIFVGKYWWWIDGVMSIIIALFILYTAYEISKDTINSIMGEQPNKKLIDEINQIALELYPKNLNLHHWHIHNYVYHRELTVHVYLPGAMLIKEGHDIIDALETEIEKRLRIETTIHIDPAEEIH